MIYYRTADIPGGLPRTSTLVDPNAPFPYLLQIADLGCELALETDEALSKGLNRIQGESL
ncbi:MAG: hypothetical protein N3G78_03210 [Desulfobacterota bacterium]|nr:hypothetical protein [Thermodesulfobacteriota bacterium]